MKFPWPDFSRRWFCLLGGLMLGLSVCDVRGSGNVNVLLWFDTEDYLLPADDDAAKRLAVMLSERGIQATFKVVGEKARVLEKRGRKDVIEALQKHDIGYHANLHSVHPTPSEYLADCGWLDGVAEFARREGGGAADVRRIFQRDTLSCYGQPGASWGSQAYGALPLIGVMPHGVPCYVDEDSHIKLDGKPFWYAGGLTVFNMAPNFTRMELLDPGAVEPANRAFDAVATRLRSEGGGLISIYYHPCEWVHREFWDGYNFKHGTNPPREDWRPPPQLPAEETEAAFARFGQYIDHLRAVSGVHFVMATNLPVLYPDRTHAEAASADNLQQIVRQALDSSGKGLDFIVHSGRAYSLADQFDLLTRAVCHQMNPQEAAKPLRATGLLGPDSAPPASLTNAVIAWPAFRDATRDVLDYLEVQHRIPSRVFIGADAVPPADFLAGLAYALDFYWKHGALPVEGGVPLGGNREILPARHVAQDTPKVFGNWVIHRAGFRAPKILEIARLQAWTLKPALPAE